MTPVLVTGTPLAHLRWDGARQPGGDLPTVLMLHGVGGGRAAWDVSGTGAMLAAAGYTALSADFPGYGASAPVQPYDLAGMAAGAAAPPPPPPPACCTTCATQTGSGREFLSG